MSSDQAVSHKPLTQPLQEDLNFLLKYPPVNLNYSFPLGGRVAPLLVHVAANPQEEKANDIALALLNGGADVNEIGEDGFSALHGAVATANQSLVRTLLDRGAKLDIPAEFVLGFLLLPDQLSIESTASEITATPLQLAKELQIRADLNLTKLTEENDEYRRLRELSLAYQDIAKILIEKNQNIEERAKKGVQIPEQFYYSLIYPEQAQRDFIPGRNLSIVEKSAPRLVRLAANPQIDRKIATDCILHELQKGNDVNARRLDNFTALHGAVATGNTDLVQILKENGANLDISAPISLENASDFEEFTPLEFAMRLAWTIDAKLMGVTEENEEYQKLRALSSAYKNIVRILIERRTLSKNRQIEIAREVKRACHDGKPEKILQILEQAAKECDMPITFGSLGIREDVAYIGQEFQRSYIGHLIFHTVLKAEHDKKAVDQKTLIQAINKLKEMGADPYKDGLTVIRELKGVDPNRKEQLNQVKIAIKEMV